MRASTVRGLARPRPRARPPRPRRAARAALELSLVAQRPGELELAPPGAGDPSWARARSRARAARWWPTRRLAPAHGRRWRAGSWPRARQIACAASSSRPELGPVAVGLLEVVADDLVELDEVGAVRARASRRSARAARRASPSAAPRRRRRGSGGGGSGRRRRPASSVRSGRTSSLRTSATRRPSTCASLGRRAPATAPRWKTWPSTAPRSSTPRSAGSSWSSRAASSAWIVGGTATSPSALGGDHRDHLLDEERVAAGRLEDPRRAARPTIPSVQRGDQLGRLLRRERLEQHVRRVQLAAAPGRPARRAAPAAPDRGAGSARRGSVGDVLDQVEEGRLAPVDVVEDDDERLLGGVRLEQLAKSPGDLLRGARPSSRRRGSRPAGRRPRPAGSRAA